jgi:hypothetical protein
VVAATPRRSEAGVKIPLNSGAYSARSEIANAQTCENLYPEINPEDASPGEPVTHYPRPGLRPLAFAPDPGRGRGIFATSDGSLYAIVKGSVYFVDAGFGFQKLGNIDDLLTPVSMSNNNQTAVLVDGTVKGYTVDLASKAFAQIVDGTGTFTGSVRVDYCDTFLIFATPNTTNWYISLSNQVAFNALNQAGKTSYPDNIGTLAFNLRQVWLFGERASTEPWFLTGAADFPYEEWPNVFIPYGIEAKYSLAQADIYLFWLTRNKQGQRIIVRNEGQAAIAVSTRAVEAEIAKYADASDAIGYTFQQNGHTFYGIWFPSADAEWRYDLATKQWHKVTSLDADGVKHRGRTPFVAQAYGMIIGQDWETGQLYELAANTFTDNGQPIAYVRAFPHVLDEAKELTASSFILNFEGTQLDENADPPPQVSVRLSKDGGVSFGNARQKTLVPGKPRNILRWRSWGMGRDLVFEASWSFNGFGVLQGAFFDAVEHST